MLTLVLVRHGESEHNATMRYHGHTDAPLTAAGRMQALALRERLGRLTKAEPLRVVSSDLGRARETARIALPDQTVTLDPRLRELHFGAFEGCSHDTCLAVHGALYRSWLIGPASVRPPGGETLAELEARVIRWLDAQPREGVTIAITHGGPIFVLLARLLDIPFDAARRAGLAHGDGVRLLLRDRPNAVDEAQMAYAGAKAPRWERLLTPPTWLSDETMGCGQIRAARRLAHARRIHDTSPREHRDASTQDPERTMHRVDDPLQPVDDQPRHPAAPRPKGRTPGRYRVPPRDRRHGLVIVNTGNGKGKTTAALGILLRAAGRDMRVAMLQFVKTADVDRGEHIAARRLGIEILALGAGFTWLSENIEEDRRLARECWARCIEVLNSGKYDVVIFDELTYALSYAWLTNEEVIEAIRARPKGTHVVITGRKASEPLLEFADLVTEMREVKHPYRTKGLAAQPGIEL